MKKLVEGNKRRIRRRKSIRAKVSGTSEDTVVFDRGGYLYHGKIKAIADGAREAGIKF